MRRWAWVGGGAGAWAGGGWGRGKGTGNAVTAARKPRLPMNDFMPRDIIGLFECFRKVRCGCVPRPVRNRTLGRTGEAHLSILDRCVRGYPVLCKPAAMPFMVAPMA